MSSSEPGSEDTTLHDSNVADLDKARQKKLERILEEFDESDTESMDDQHFARFVIAKWHHPTALRAESTAKLMISSVSEHESSQNRQRLFQILNDPKYVRNPNLAPDPLREEFIAAWNIVKDLGYESGDDAVITLYNLHHIFIAGGIKEPEEAERVATQVREILKELTRPE